MMIAQLALAAFLYLALLALLWQMYPKFQLMPSSLGAGILMALGLVVIFYSSPFEAADLSISDSVEYVLATVSGMENGVFGLPIDADQLVPSRYPPWFSAFVLLPWYKTLGTFPGVGILLNYVSILVVGYAVFCIVLRTSRGSPSAPLAALLLVAVPGLRYFSGHILTDVPSLAIICVAVAWGLRLSETSAKEREPHLTLLLSATVLLFALILRPTNAVCGIPLTRELLRRKRLDAVLMWLPGISLGFVQLWYNNKVFGNPLISGYHYWVPIPYQSLFETFSLGYAFSNLKSLLPDLLLPLSLLLALLIGARRQGGDLDAVVRLMRMCLWVVLPLLLFYVPYFYYTPRFYLPIHGLVWILIAALLVQWWRPSHRLVLSVVVAILCLSFLFQGIRAERKPARLLVMQQLLAQASPEDTISSAIDPVYAQYWISRLPESSRPTYVPASRESEYASKAILLAPIERPFPNWRDAKATREFLLGRGAKLPIRYTLLDETDFVFQPPGTVYLDRKLLSPELLEAARHYLRGRLILIN